ncbi:uncharacterized protein [Rutidosis leptorrhynchoides]|uniref:uncharacterized protein n=1 Tax=Rutidosis leptorrhynchoides TaxID=125765 RepID=UPI003A99772F
MGFGGKWRKWILSFLKTASISILVNGSPTKEFKLERGVRQGDPLSPFLFIIAAEGLNWLTKAAVSNNLFKGAEVGRNKIPISLLQYADDTIFFGKWNVENTESVLKLLKCFKLTSGLKINYNKSDLFGVKVDCREVEAIARIFDCKGGTGSEEKISWVKWVDVIRPFDEGGLNLGSLDYKNMALIGKWWWRFKTETNSLWVKVIKSFYGNSSLLDTVGQPHTFVTNTTWIHIVKTGLHIDSLGVNFKASFVKSIGNGKATSFWKDVWILDVPLKEKFSRLAR